MKMGADGKMPYNGVFDCARKIATNEGLLAFYTGFGAFYMRTAPHAMITVVSIEAIT